MKVLWLCPFVPFPPESGSSIRVFAMLERLAKHHHVTLVCLDDPLHASHSTEALQNLCRSVHLLPSPSTWPMKLHHVRWLFSEQPGSLALGNRRLAAQLRTIAASDAFDLVQVEFLPLAEMALELEIPVRVVTEHYLAIEAYEDYAATLARPGLRRWYFQRELRKLRKWEPAVLSRFTHAIVTSQPHWNTVSDWMGKGRVTEITNGVDAEYFAPMAAEVANEEFLFMGSFHLNPANVRTLAVLLDNVLPELRRRMPGVIVHVVGRGLPADLLARGIPNVRFHGYVQDVRPLLGRVAAMLLPMVGGSGTKLRVPTAMAMGKVVITTPDGLAGSLCEDGREVLVARDWQEMAEQAARVSADAALRERIGRAARRAAVERFSWTQLAARQSDLWGALCVS